MSVCPRKKIMKTNSRFTKGSGVYTCRVCGHRTRDTGGDGAGVKLCEVCYDLAGEENHIDNNGDTYDSADIVKQLLAFLDKRNGAGTAKSCFPVVCESVGY